MKTTLPHTLRNSVATLVVGTALLAGPAFAQQAPATQPGAAQAEGNVEPADTGAIIVTGSISRNPAAATASPVTVVTSQDLLSRGVTSTAEALQQLTANNAGTAPGSWSSHGFATGASTVSLRGLNDAYTLILFDGMRMAPYPLADDGTRTIVDVNSVPNSVVNSIEVLQDSASATYGSDAIAGVVNVLVKKQVVGLHANMSAGISQRGDAGERRADVTYGYGKLDEQGFNVYANFEYQKNDALMQNARGFPFNTADLSSICGSSIGSSTVAAGSTTCMVNSVANGVQAGGGYNGFATTTAPFVRPYTVGANGAPGTATGPYQFLNPALGCNGLTAYTLTTAQLAGLSATSRAQQPTTVCQQDLVKQYGQYNPDIRRLGGTLRGTVKLSDSVTAYAMFNFYNVKTDNVTTPGAFTGTPATAPDGRQVTISAVYLPVYVCSAGTGTIAGGNAYATGCNAGNGTLNPNNPFAAQGQLARLAVRNDIPRETLTDTKSYRISGGIDGSFDGFDWGIGATTSWVTLDRVQKGYFTVQGLLDSISKGTFNFTNFGANSDAARQGLFPDNYNHAISKLSQVVGHIGKDFFQLPGGQLNVTVGAQWRFEAIHAPSPNPSNADPYQRYYTLNAAGVDGSRHQYSLSYEVTAPILENLKVKAEGSYDHYSTGQARFSPKFEAEFSPIEQVKLRGTWGKGFRVPNFVEAFGLPTTGYVTTQINCQKYVAFCAAHASNPAYTAGTYSYGLTSVANPALAPEKSTSWTAGVAFQPTRRISLTADWWSVKIKDVIVGPQGSSALLDQYYQNNGVISVPGYAVTQSSVDPLNPTALPLLGTVVASFTNADSFKAEGIDFNASIRIPLNSSGLEWTSKATASYLHRLEQTSGGVVQRYDGTLGPCNITSCSGAPKWRALWTNTVDFNGRGNVSLTATYTGPYSQVATDEGGVYGDCIGSVGAQAAAYADTVTPVTCTGKASFNLDMTGQLKVGDHFTIYANILNLLNQSPTFDPGAAYGLYNFNPAWQDRQFIGRYFRVGAKVDF